jgi:capsule polysaccharide export protein KpsE/RkpR
MLRKKKQKLSETNQKSKVVLCVVSIIENNLITIEKKLLEKKIYANNE